MFSLREDGVFQIYENATGAFVNHITTGSTPITFSASDAANSTNGTCEFPTIREYFMDMDYILNVISDGPTKSFAFRRLRYLESKFHMYVLLNEYQEIADSKR